MLIPKIGEAASRGGRRFRLTLQAAAIEVAIY
jgi:hypothetical protein